MGSCKTYDQKPSDDGKGLSVGSIHGVIGLKFSSLVNSDLTWKRVAKGSRSSSRRARNSLCKSWMAGEELLKLDPNTVASPFSESEELGVSVLGCHFSENAENLPVKKRKFSKQPKKNKKPMNNLVESVTYASCPSDLGKTVDTQQEVDGKTSEMVSSDVQEDFSGILILADAACNDGCRGADYHLEGVSAGDACCADEDPSMKNQLDPLSNRNATEECSSAKSSIHESGDGISVKLADDFTASPRMHNNNSATLRENDMLDKSIDDCSVAVSEDLLTKKNEEKDRVCEFPLQDVRLYWDLNTPMDSWRCPLEQPIVDSDIADGISKEVKCGHHSDKIGSSGSETIQEVPHDNICDTEIRLPPADPGGMVHYEKSSEKMELNLDSWTDIDRTSCSQEKLYSPGCVDFVSTDSAIASTDQCKSASVESSTFCSAETTRKIVLNQVAGSNSCVDNLFPAKCVLSLSSCISKAICDTEAAGVTSVTSAKNADGGAASTWDTVSSSLQIGDVVDLAAHHATSSVSNMFETQDVLNEDAKDAKENSSCQSTEEESLSCSPIGVEKLGLGMVTLDSSVQNVNVGNDGTDNVWDEGCEKPVTYSPEVSTALLHALAPSDACQNKSKDVVTFDEIATEEPFGNSNHSGVSQDVHAYAKLDNASQYEDGEVREPVEYNWQECDGEDIEAEHVIYGTDTVSFGSRSEQIMPNMDFQTHSGMLEGEDPNSIIETGANIHIIPKVETDKEITGGMISSAMDNRMVGEGNDSGWKNIHCEVGGLDRIRMAESRAFKRDSCSRIGEQSQSFRDASFREDRRRYMQHLQARAQGTDRMADSRDSSRGIRRHYSPRYDGSMPSHRLGPPKIMHRRLRSGSPDDRDEDLGPRMHIRPTRNLSPGWRVTLGRGRSIRYGLQGQGRGPMSRYRGVVTDDCNDSSVTYLHPSSKRERSPSPVIRRIDPRARRSPSKSSSRSRSHSSSAENPYFGCRSRSPNFGSACRNQRLRSPNQRPGHLVDRTEGFRSTPRIHNSPPRNRQWIIDRKDSPVQFRDPCYNKHSSFLVRRPQGRFVQQDDRFDLVDSPRSYRPMHPRRYNTEMGGGGGGLKYEENDDDRGRRRFRYNPPQRVKRYDMDEPVKQRFHLDNNNNNNIDGYDAARYRDDVVDFCGRGNSKFNGIDRQNSDVSRKFRGSFKYQREEKYKCRYNANDVRGGTGS